MVAKARADIEQKMNLKAKHTLRILFIFFITHTLCLQFKFKEI
ncbi:MAG: hypothetical protein ACI936_002428 [Paraglaciecola sp.]|jgi:hypothetical protein